MKIGNQPDLPGALAQAAAAKQARAAAAPASDAPAKSATAASAAGVPVTFSSTARSLDANSRATGEFDAARVKAVRASIEQGSFKINAEAIADKLLANAEEVMGRSRS